MMVKQALHRGFFGLFVCLTMCASFQAIAQQAGLPYPSKSIRIVVPFAPGGPADLLGRLVATGLGTALGQPVVVDNRTGAGGGVGAEFVAKSAPDGYTLLVSNVGDTISPALYKSMPFSYERDLIPVSLVASTPFVIVVNPGVPVRTTAELIQLARSKPGSVTFGSAGIGVASHLSGELFKQMAGIDIVHVPYKGQAPATTDLLGGQITFMFNNPIISLPYAKSGKLRAIAVTGTERIEAAPDIPTVAESGLPGFEAGTWFGIVAPAGTPREIVDRLNREIGAVTREPDYIARIEKLGYATTHTTPDEMRALIRRDGARWGTLIKGANIRAE
jgi:tripartite-type tricarboxylate transporter receptor subunit TctC